MSAGTHPHPTPDRAALQREQLAKLRQLLAKTGESNRFYSAKFQATGGWPLVTTLEAFLLSCPFTRKAELCEDQRRHPPYGTALTLPRERYSRCHQTSGSTGLPLRWLDTPESWQNLLGHWSLILAAATVTAADRCFFAFSFGPFLGFWSAFEAAARLNCFCLPGGALNTTARLRALLDHGITVLFCTPTYALRLCEVAAAERLDLSTSPLRLIVTAGEPGGSIPATRARLAATWPRARVFDHHGMTEVGPVTYECPAQPGTLHVLESAFLPEIVDPHSGAAMPAGQRGELVLTTLERTASPLLRYRTGDLVQAATRTPCPCGCPDLALEGGILGRTDDMVIVRGVNLYPSAVENVLRQFADVAEYQVLLTSEGAQLELRLQVEPTPMCPNPEDLARRVEQALQTAFALRIPVSLTAVGALPRFDMKARRWHRL